MIRCNKQVKVPVHFYELRGSETPFANNQRCWNCRSLAFQDTLSTTEPKIIRSIDISWRSLKLQVGSRPVGECRRTSTHVSYVYTHARAHGRTTPKHNSSSSIYTEQKWHSAGSEGWPFPLLKYKYIFFQIKITEAML